MSYVQLAQAISEIADGSDFQARSLYSFYQCFRGKSVCTWIGDGLNLCKL